MRLLYTLENATEVSGERSVGPEVGDAGGTPFPANSSSRTVCHWQSTVWALQREVWLAGRDGFSGQSPMMDGSVRRLGGLVWSEGPGVGGLVIGRTVAA